MCKLKRRKKTILLKIYLFPQFLSKIYSILTFKLIEISLFFFKVPLFFQKIGRFFGIIFFAKFYHSKAYKLFKEYFLEICGS